MSGWIGVDLDGTLAYYTNWEGPESIGAPIPLMLEKVKRWLDNGVDVRIFTARVSNDGTPEGMDASLAAYKAIALWSQQNIGKVIPVTNKKDYHMRQCYDDRATQVVPNTGQTLREVLKNLVEAHQLDSIEEFGKAMNCAEEALKATA